MSNIIPFKSYCWALGTTSFRTKDFNKTIETQLTLLDEFWSLPENKDLLWSGNDEIQERYYLFMKEHNFVEGDANKKAKDAREKTSGLKDIGLINDNRRLTAVGEAIRELTVNNDFKSNNELKIDNDSYIYLKQLLKTFNYIEGQPVRPFIVLLHLLTTYNYLSLDEYTYLLPLCVNIDTLNKVENAIIKLRSNRTTIDNEIINILMSMPNYQTALHFFLNNSVTEDIICEIGINRKSRSYDKPYYKLYTTLYDVFINKKINSLEDVYMATKNINIGRYWRSYIFDTTSAKAISKSPGSHLNSTLFNNVSSIDEFKETFFKLMHLFKAKSTLSDYLDLNRRYIKTTDIILFEDDLVKLDIIPKYYFENAMPSLYKEMFIESENLYENCPISDISSGLVFNEKYILNGISNELNTTVRTLEEANLLLYDNRYKRFNKLIDSKFTDEKLLVLLEHFENRNDNEIREMVTDNADIPTIFEYVLGIVWYKISEKQGDILSYMKLSLDADLLPKTHAVGGEADIVYEYNKTDDYPEHTVLLEATLADNTNQRRMEMEPVSRHLGRHLLRTRNMNSYCVFITTYLDINVISDFNTRKHMNFYDTQDYDNYITGMKIMPLQTSELKMIIKKNLTYKKLYQIFDDAYKEELPPHVWYYKTITDIIQMQ